MAIDKKAADALIMLKNQIYKLEKAKEVLQQTFNAYSEIHFKLQQVATIQHTDEDFKRLEKVFGVKSGRATVIERLQKELKEADDKVQAAVDQANLIVGVEP